MELRGLRSGRARSRPTSRIVAEGGMHDEPGTLYYYPATLALSA